MEIRLNRVLKFCPRKWPLNLKASKMAPRDLNLFQITIFEISGFQEWMKKKVPG